MVESIYFLKPAWCGNHFAGLWPEQGLQPVTGATALRRWFVRVAMEFAHEVLGRNQAVFDSCVPPHGIWRKKYDPSTAESALRFSNQARVTSSDGPASNATAGWNTSIPELRSFRKSASVKFLDI
jgi:hypothetical protein